MEATPPFARAPRWRTSRLVPTLLILLTCVGCDQATKALARRTLAPLPPISLWRDLVRFEYAENSGAFLSLGANWPEAARFTFLIAFSGLALILMLAFALRAHGVDRWQWLAVTLFIGGGMGNLIDRITRAGAVVDFVSIGVGPLRTGTFNVADVAITGGALLFVIASFHRERTVA